MTVIFPLDLPSTIGMESITLYPTDAVATSSSPFTYKQQVIAHGGQQWAADVVIPSVDRTFAAPWTSFLIKLKGQVGTFLMGDPNAYYPQGSIYDIGGTITVDGDSQTGETLFVRGLPASEEGLLLEGDYIQLGTGSSARLHMVLTDLDSDSSGDGSIDIWPSLRSSPSDGSEVYYEGAKGLFRLSSNQRQYSIDSSSQYAISFSAVEVIT